MFLACLHVGVHGGLVQMTQIFRHQQSRLLSQNFGKRIAKDSFRCPIREQDDAIVIDADDGVRRGLCNDAGTIRWIRWLRRRVPSLAGPSDSKWSSNAADQPGKEGTLPAASAEQVE